MVLRFLMDYYRHTGDASWQRLVQTTVDSLLDSPLWLGTRGAVCTYSHTPDWQTPSWEIEAVDQAGLLRALCQSRDPSRRAAARQLVGYLQRELLRISNSSWNSAALN